MDLKLYNQIFNDMWQLLKKYSTIRRTEDYWTMAVREIGGLSQRKYNENPLAVALGVAILDELERVERAEGSA